MITTSAFNSGGEGSNTGWAVKIPHTSQLKIQKVKQKQYCNKFYEDFKNGPHEKKKSILKKEFQEERFIHNVKV